LPWIGLILGYGILTHGVIFLYDGLYWDGWLVDVWQQNGDSNSMRRFYSEVGMLNLYFEHRILGRFPWRKLAYRAISLVSILSIAVFVFLIAVRTNERAAASLGISVFRVKLETPTSARPAPPLHRWQRVQWQKPIASGSCTSYVTCPHRHAPWIVSLIGIPFPALADGGGASDYLTAIAVEGCRCDWANREEPARATVKGSARCAAPARRRRHEKRSATR
jgi:hypothetical protein